jgi:hypothetical protein
MKFRFHTNRRYRDTLNDCQLLQELCCLELACRIGLPQATGHWIILQAMSVFNKLFENVL